MPAGLDQVELIIDIRSGRVIHATNTDDTKGVQSQRHRHVTVTVKQCLVTILFQIGYQWVRIRDVGGVRFIEWNAVMMNYCYLQTVAKSRGDPPNRTDVNMAVRPFEQVSRVQDQEVYAIVFINIRRGGFSPAGIPYKARDLSMIRLERVSPI
jgi:hypothetical protein